MADAPRKPVIGLAGGIGSGKTFVARLFAELGCAVIVADDQVRVAYADPAVRATLRGWWGEAAFDPADGSVRRAVVADRIFTSATERVRVEQLLHGWVAADRDRLMAAADRDPAVVAVVWDTPLLYEVGLEGRCDAVVFVDVPEEVRFERVRVQRGWSRAELIRRQNLQLPLDKKRARADYVLVGTADVAAVHDQIRAILSVILER